MVSQLGSTLLRSKAAVYPSELGRIDVVMPLKMSYMAVTMSNELTMSQWKST